MASSTYAGIEESFGISNEVAILTVSLFVMGLGVGPLLLGPVSEFIGRRAVYLGSYVAFLREFIDLVLSAATDLVSLTSLHNTGSILEQCA